MIDSALTCARTSKHNPAEQYLLSSRKQKKKLYIKFRMKVVNIVVNRAESDLITLLREAFKKKKTKKVKQTVF